MPAKWKFLFLSILWLVLISLPSCSPPPAEKEFPIDLEPLIPSDWIPEKLEEVDLDDDGEREWLLLYRHSPGAPLGGVIYDVQIEAPTPQLRPEVPYRVTYVPYRLLPGIAPGKGQGYLGESNCEIEKYDTDGDGKQDELVIVGYSLGQYPTQISFFRWGKEERKYELTNYFYGDGGVSYQPSSRPSEERSGQKIEEIVVKKKLHDRSQICQKMIHRRKKDDVTYEQIDGPILDFTFSIPSRPFYPEAAVLAYYLSMAGEAKVEGYMTQEGQLRAQELAEKELGLTAGVKNARVIGLTYPGSISPTNVIEINGNKFEYVDVTVTVRLDGTPMEVTWRVINMSSGGSKKDVMWKLHHIVSSRKLSE